MEAELTTSDAVTAAIKEMDRLAFMLGMPELERQNVLGLNQSAYKIWHSGSVDPEAAVAPELARRLAYVLPLMRRMAANLPTLPPGRDLRRLFPKTD